MKRPIAILAAALLTAGMWSANAEKLVLLHTNDTHSEIYPDDNDLGGIARRKAVIDSIRAEHKNVLLMDAGDAVQGTLFFNLYSGEVETLLMNTLGYDYAIAGNHCFDNGSDALAKNLAKSKVTYISTNYDLAGGVLEPYFKPYAIREFDGKKIGIIGLNLIPKGMISEGNYDGVRYIDAIKAANATAWHMKHNEKVDLVIAITHLGYDETSPSDIQLANASEDIDIILGGHTHTVIRPGSGKEWIKNAAGDSVLVAQNGKAGKLISEITINLDSIGAKAPAYRHIAVNSRLDNRLDPSIDSLLAPYKDGVDRLMKLKIGRTAKALSNKEAPLLNFISDFILESAPAVTGEQADIAIMNKGSIRRGLPKGDITHGQVIIMQPFFNRIVVEDLRGADLADAFDIMASRGGDGVSEGVDITFDPATKKCTSIKINGKPLDPSRTYKVATIDYLANGGDYMEPLTRGYVTARSKNIVHNDLIDYIKNRYKGQKINPSDQNRMRPE